MSVTVYVQFVVSLSLQPLLSLTCSQHWRDCRRGSGGTGRAGFTEGPGARPGVQSGSDWSGGNHEPLLDPLSAIYSWRALVKALNELKVEGNRVCRQSSPSV